MTENTAIDQKSRKHLKTVVHRAQLVLFWEQVWPLLFNLLLIFLTFLALSWLGVWPEVSPLMRLLGLAVFAAVISFVILQARSIRWPTEEQAINRIENVSGVDHRPLTAFVDTPVSLGTTATDQQQQLWEAHQARIRAGLAKMRAGKPERQIEWRDPFALRAVIILLAVISLSVAGPQWAPRLGDIFVFSERQTPVIARLDAWITPPTYTSRPPIFLTKENFDDASQALLIPEGSLMTIRAVNADNPIVTFQEDGQEAFVIGATGEATDTDSTRQTPKIYEYKLATSGIVQIATSGKTQQWAFDIIKDQAPTIAYATNPTIQRSGAIEVVAIINDDYGVVKAHGDIRPTETTRKTLNSKTTRPLYDPPKFPLTLNRGRVKDGGSKTIRSIVDHPWAGSEVSMTLRAFDEAELEGASDPITFTLPSRRFNNPIARALIEQRRNLALDGNYANRLVDIVDVLTLRPEQFDKDYGTLIALAAVRRGLLNARNDDALRNVVDELWEIATGIEDGDLSEAEKNLRDALQALREGIENGASEEELARLMEEARQAMREFMQALAEQAQQNNQQAQNQNQQQIDPSQILNPQDLERMLDRIEDLAQTGSKDAAQQLLSELQQMMENLQANRNQPGQRGDSQAQQMLNELGDMIRRQQELMDQTFRQQNQQNQQNRQGYQGQQGQQRSDRQSERGQNGQRGQQPGQQPGQGSLEQLLRDLEGNQQALSDRLRNFLEQMQRNGVPGNQQLGDAQRSMNDAARDIGEGDLPAAGDDQNEALNQLRSGAQQLANQMAGEGQGEGDHDLAQGDRRIDPLGRQERTRGSDFGDSVKVPDEIDTQRAREILDAIRKRLGETLRPTIELEYLERLLRSQ